MAKNNLWTLVISAYIGIIGSILATFIFPILEEYLPVFVGIIIVLTGMVLLLDSMINKVNEEQIRLEGKIEKLEGSVDEKITQVEKMIDARAEIKYLKDKILRIEEMKDGS